ncbi:MAG: WD40 repeat domain-containing protein, partial [Candidatus Eremiobacterota bacterium]
IQACGDPDPTIAAAALSYLEGLAGEEARDEVARALVDSNLPPPAAVEQVLRLGFAPREPAQRALYFFLTGQMERYDDLDYDHSLLRAVFPELPDGVRNRVVARIRESGRADLTPIIQLDQPRRHLHGLTPVEYETVLSVLRSAGRLDELWGMVFQSAPEWAAEILGVLERDGFQPPAHDSDVYRLLLRDRPKEGRDLRLQLPEMTLNARVQSFPGSLRSMAFSPDGKILAVGGSHSHVRLWDPYRGRSLGDLEGHKGLVSALAFSPDGRRLASAGSDGGAYLWDPVRQRRLRSLLPSDEGLGILSLHFSPTGRWLAVGGWHSVLLLVDVVEERVLPLRGHEACVVTCAFSPDERWLASASWDKTVRVWDLDEPSDPVVLQGHRDRLMGVAFDEDNHLISVSLDGQVLRWEAEAWREAVPLLPAGFHSGPIWKLAVHPQGRLVATSGSDSAIRIWRKGKSYPPLPGHSGRTTALAFSRDGYFLASAGSDSRLLVWEVGDDQVDPLHPGGSRNRPAPFQPDGPPNCLSFAPDSRTLATGSETGTVTFWSLFQTKPIATMDEQDLERIQVWARRHPDGQQRSHWGWVAEVLRQRFRHDIELGQGTAVFDEFAIDIE